MIDPRLFFIERCHKILVSFGKAEIVTGKVIIHLFAVQIDHPEVAVVHIHHLHKIHWAGFESVDEGAGHQ